MGAGKGISWVTPKVPRAALEVRSSRSTLGADARRGRWLLATAIAVTLLGDAGVILLKVFRSGFFASGGSYVRWFLTVALFSAVWQGRRWARRLMVGLSGTGFLLVLLAVTRSPHPLHVVLLLQFGLTCGVLAFSSSVTAFLDYQRTRPPDPTPASSLSPHYRSPEKPSPSMIGTPPSARGLRAIPADPAEHAARSAQEWQALLESYARRRMRELGIPKERIGSNDHKHGLSQAAFNPYERIGGSVGTIGEINLDAGVLNPDLMRKFGPEAGEAWRRASLRTRCDTAIAHEYEEGRGFTHDQAVDRAPDTDLPVSHEARELASKIRDGMHR